MHCCARWLHARRRVHSVCKQTLREPRMSTGKTRPDASIGLSGIPPDSRESASVADGGLSEASPCDQAPAGASRFPAGPPTSGAHPINASRNCASFGADRGIRERGAPHLTVTATPFSPGPRRGTPRSVELRCEAFVFFPSVDFYSRPREMRSGELPRLRPPRVESWRACRGGLEGAGKNWGGVPW